MNRHSQIVNPRQQPSRRHYNRERDRYYEDERRDFARGADYNEQARYGRQEDYLPHDYYDGNYRFAPYDRQRSYSDYTPSVDYGYDDDEYHSPDPSHDHYRHSRATGYGNRDSLQARDFEDWRETASRHRNWEPGDFRGHHFPGHPREDHNRDFESGMYDYRREQRYHERFREEPLERMSTRPGRPDAGRAAYRRLHGRSDRHPEIVTPFKEDRYYGRNDYNYSEGYGDNEFVYHDDQRRPFEEGGDFVN